MTYLAQCLCLENEHLAVLTATGESLMNAKTSSLISPKHQLFITVTK
jgi:hypothetical protein